MRGHATAGQNTRWLTAWNLISTDGSRNQWHEDFIDVRLRRNSGIDRDGQPMRQALRSIGAVLVKIRHGRVCQEVEKFRRVVIRRDDVTTLPSSPPSYPDSHPALAA